MTPLDRTIDIVPVSSRRRPAGSGLAGPGLADLTASV
jgi:hypothetical protein